jgi:hypothetical protein
MAVLQFLDKGGCSPDILEASGSVLSHESFLTCTSPATRERVERLLDMIGVETWMEFGAIRRLSYCCYEGVSSFLANA